MFATVSNLLLHKQMIFGDGNIEIFGQQVVMTPLLTEVNILRELEKKGLQNTIYYAAKEAGKEWFNGMATIYGLKPQDIMKWGPELINLGGWGTVKPIKVDVNALEFNFQLLNSTFAKKYGKSQEPVDHYFRGLLTGAWQMISKHELEGIETECSATGAGACKFVLLPKEKIDWNNEIVKKQLEKR